MAPLPLMWGYSIMTASMRDDSNVYIVGINSETAGNNLFHARRVKSSTALAASAPVQVSPATYHDVKQHHSQFKSTPTLANNSSSLHSSSRPFRLHSFQSTCWPSTVTTPSALQWYAIKGSAPSSAKAHTAPLTATSHGTSCISFPCGKATLLSKQPARPPVPAPECTVLLPVTPGRQLPTIAHYPVRKVLSGCTRAAVSLEGQAPPTDVVQRDLHGWCSRTSLEPALNDSLSSSELDDSSSSSSLGCDSSGGSEVSDTCVSSKQLDVARPALGKPAERTPSSHDQNQVKISLPTHQASSTGTARKCRTGIRPYSSDARLQATYHTNISSRKSRAQAPRPSTTAVTAQTKPPSTFPSTRAAVYFATDSDHAVPAAAATSSSSALVGNNERPYPCIAPPVFPGALPTVSFVSPAEGQGICPLTKDQVYVKFNGVANAPVKHAFKAAGFRVTAGHKWNVLWGAILKPESHAGLHEFQRVNHFLGTWQLGRKDRLYQNVQYMKRCKGDAFDFIPQFYILPRDYEQFRNDLQRHPTRLYIQKPVASSRGRGVKMLSNPSDVQGDVKDCVIQQYIDKPLTLHGHKFDMRVYVAVTCLDPLRVYVYPEGLARLATQPYNTSKTSLKERCMHLTNFSINKKAGTRTSVSSSSNSEAEPAMNFKWSFAELRSHMEDVMKVQWAVVWDQVHAIVAKTLISVESRMNTAMKMSVPHRCNCFELFGFDILLDTSLRAWLIEVNTSPSLGTSTPIDKQVKYPMVADLMHMVGVVPYNRDVYEEQVAKQRQARLTGLGGSNNNKLMPKVKTVRDAVDMDFRGLSDFDQLPPTIQESEAEYARRCRWEAVFPCADDPLRYMDLFECPRTENVLLSRYLASASRRCTRN